MRKCWGRVTTLGESSTNKEAIRHVRVSLSTKVLAHLVPSLWERMDSMFLEPKGLDNQYEKELQNGESRPFEHQLPAHSQKQSCPG